MSNHNELSKPIEDSSKSLVTFLKGFEIPNDGSYLSSAINFEKFHNQDVFNKHINGLDLNYGIKELKKDFENEEDKGVYMKEVAKFNEGLDQKVKDFIILSAFQMAADEIIEPLLGVVKTGSGDSILKLSSLEFGGDELAIYSQLCVLFDFEIFLISTEYPSIKNVFFSTLSQVSDILYSISTEAIEKFWFYLESRVDIMDKVFDKSAVSDRIAMLEICNNLTDKFKFKNAQGKTDSYFKDTFNDSFQYRVRTFITSMFAFDDNTGLNKYFSTANRSVNEFIPSSKYNKNSDFLRDVLSIKRLFNDPYFYLKPNNHRLLSKVADTMRTISQYLLEDEKAYVKTLAKVDQFIIKKENLQSEVTNLKSVCSVESYFAESYWLSPFNESKKDAQYEELKKKDIEFGNSQLEVSKFRRTLLLQIYILCNFLYEINSSNKKEFISSLGSSSTLKHITDNSSPDNLVSLFYKMKREIPNKLRDIDNQFSFLVQHLALTEMFWWGWLIYGKDSATGKPLFADKVLTDLELKATEEKAKSLFPVKVKRYFNIYGTPQLSRKMKIPIGLDRLKHKKNEYSFNFATEIEKATASLDTLTNAEEREQVLEKRNVYLWKHLNLQRSKQWLQFGSLLAKEMLEDTNKPEKEQKHDADDLSMEENKDNDSVPTPYYSEPVLESSTLQKPTDTSSTENLDTDEQISTDKMDIVEEPPVDANSNGDDQNSLKRHLKSDSDTDDQDSKRLKS